MADNPADSEAQETTRKREGPFHWLVDPQRRRFLLPASGLWILVLDWLLFSSNAVSLGLATPIVVVLGFLFGGAGVLFIQQRFAHDKLWITVLKAVLAGVVVGAPWPLAGTMIGGYVLFFSGLGKVPRQVLRTER